MSLLLEQGDLILFQGDSITDCGRSRDNDVELGRGYANMTAAWLGMMFPGLELRFFNRGIGGNRVKDLRARWQADCLDLEPDWISILIGINDTWRRYDRDDATSAEAYAEDYRHILEQVRAETEAELILLEPFVLPHPEDRMAWREDLDPKIQAVRGLAREFGAVYVPLDGIFAAACTERDPAFWAADGVHPTQAGHALIAHSWLQAIGVV